jgi:hypothetical protein
MSYATFGLERQHLDGNMQCLMPTNQRSCCAAGGCLLQHCCFSWQLVVQRSDPPANPPHHSMVLLGHPPALDAHFLLCDEVLYDYIRHLVPVYITVPVQPVHCGEHELQHGYAAIFAAHCYKVALGARLYHPGPAFPCGHFAKVDTFSGHQVHASAGATASSNTVIHLQCLRL